MALPESLNAAVRAALFGLCAGLSGCAFISGLEYASRLDLDADGVERPRDCDDGDPDVGEAAVGYVDDDGDGLGSSEQVVRCPGDGSVAIASGDCDDADPSILPGAVETCNGLDDDCDGLVDDSIAVPNWFVDADGDGFGAGAPIQACEQPARYSATGDDCDDGDPLINPDTVWYADLDGDGFGDPTDTQISCTRPDDRVLDATDCNDGDATIHPAGVEVCDDANVDEDCDGLVDDADIVAGPFHVYYADADGDGYGDAYSPTQRCDAAGDLVDNHADCDDTDVASASSDCPWWFVTTADQSAACGIRTDGTVECWGAAARSGVPTEPVMDVALDFYGAVAVTTLGEITCWGESSSPLVTDCPSDGTWMAVDVGYNSACALNDDGGAVCWGDAGDMVTDPPVAGYSHLEIGEIHACAWDDAGSGECWGDCSRGQCTVPSPVEGVGIARVTTAGLSGGALEYSGTCSNHTCDGGAGTYTRVAGGVFADTVCAVTTGAELECWGRDSSTPPAGTNYADVAVATNFACAVTTEGGIDCWGNCGYGQCDPPE